MPDTKEILRNRVAERLLHVPKTPRAVSLEIGANQGYVRDLLDPDKTSIPGGDRLQRLAAALDTTTDYLLGRVELAEQPISEVSFREMPPKWSGAAHDGIPLLGSGYCDDLIVETDGESFEIERAMLDIDHTVRLIERPPALWNAREAYAIYFHGSSMERRFYQGEVGIVDPRRPPSPGDCVVVQLTDGTSDSVVTVLVKELVRASSREVELLQYNPELRFRIPRNRVARMHRILNSNEILGA